MHFCAHLFDRSSKHRTFLFLDKTKTCSIYQSYKPEDDLRLNFNFYIIAIIFLFFGQKNAKCVQFCTYFPLNQSSKYDSLQRFPEFETFLEHGTYVIFSTSFRAWIGCNCKLSLAELLLILKKNPEDNSEASFDLLANTQNRTFRKVEKRIPPSTLSWVDMCIPVVRTGYCRAPVHFIYACLTGTFVIEWMMVATWLTKVQINAQLLFCFVIHRTQRQNRPHFSVCVPKRCLLCTLEIQN